MWHLKFKVKHSDCIFAPLAEKHKVSIEFYPLREYRERGFLFTSAVHIANGRESDIKRYLGDLKKNSKIIELEISKVIFTLTKIKDTDKTYESIYSPKLLYVSPGYNSSDGFETWDVASWDRKELEKIIKTIEKAKTTEYFEILRFEEKNLDEIYILQLFPKFPEKQKEAMELAYSEGYYKYPRKINLDKLARKAKVSKQTFQENLKKAENRLMPLLLRK